MQLLVLKQKQAKRLKDLYVQQKMHVNLSQIAALFISPRIFGRICINKRKIYGQLMVWNGY